MNAKADGNVPRNLREDFLCSTFAEALMREFVGVDDDFFGIGGDSLRATMALVRIRERLDASISTRAFFELRTAEKVAAALAATAAGYDAEDVPADDDDARLGLVLRRLSGGAAAGVSVEPIASTVRGDLGRAVREYSRSNSLAPSVIYLSAWCDVLHELDARFFPTDVQVGAWGAASEAWLLTNRPASSGAVATMDDLSALQRCLLRGSGGPERSSPTTERPGSSFIYARSDTAVPPSNVAPSARAPFGLAVVDGAETRFELIASAPSELPGRPESLLSDYTERLAHLLQKHLVSAAE
jgi:acyl carrier protein